MYLLALFFLFVTNLPDVDDIVNQGTCDWSCRAVSNIDEEESRNLLAKGNLAKFRVLYEEQVHGECANQTDAKNSSETASLWLKMADGGKHQAARLQFFTETVLDGILRGQFAFGAYKEVNVSCIFKLLSIGKSRRLTFRTSQSVLYFVEHEANFSKPHATFLTLLRTEKNTRVSVGVTDTSGSLSSAKSANDNEVIVTDAWFAVAIIISIVVLLYFPAIFIFFRPSEIKLKVPRRQQVPEDIRTTDEAAERERRRLHLPKNVQSTDGSCYIEPDIHEGHPTPVEHGVMISSQSNSSSAGSHEGSEIAEGTFSSSLSSEIQHGGGAIPGYSGSAEPQRPSDQESEITLTPRYPSKSVRRNGSGYKQKGVNEKNQTKLGSLPEDLDATNDSHTKYGSRFSDARTSTYNVPPRSETSLTGSSTTNDQPFSSDGEFDSTVTIKEPFSNRNISALNSSQNRNNDSAEQASTSQSDQNIEEPSVANSLNDAEQASASQSNRNIEEPSAADILNNAAPESTSQSDGNSEEPSVANSLNDAEQASTSQSNRNIEEPSAADILNNAAPESTSQSDGNSEEPSAADILNNAAPESTSQSDGNSEEPSVANSLNDAEQASASQSNRNIEEPSAADILNNAAPESTSQSDGNSVEPSVAKSINDAEQASTSQSDGNTEEPSFANSINDAEQASTSQSDGNTEEPSFANSINDAEQASTSQSDGNTEEPSFANSINDAEQASTSQSDGNTEGPSAANSLNDAKQASTSQSDRNIEDPSDANSLNNAEQASNSQSDRNIEELSVANSLNNAEQASNSQSDRNTEGPSAANSLNETRVVIDQSSEEEDNEGTKYALAIIVGETYPVGFGSFIGNKLFSTTHERNIAWNIVKLIFMFLGFPLLFFLGLGDLFLLLLPKLHSRLSDHFPSTFLTRSFHYGFFTSHPILLGLIVVSALAYLIRLFPVCFLSRSTLEEKWQSCCVHRMHPNYFASKFLQCCFSELPSCNCQCNPALSECSKYLELPQNISHNLENLTDIFINCWKCCSGFWKRNSICSPKGIFFSLVLVLTSIIFIIIGIFSMSPLVCLCQGRLRLSGFRVVESSVMLFCLVWVTIFSLLCAIPLGVATTGLIKLLESHTIQVLPQVTILAVVLHYFWSCYKSFREPYRYVTKFLASRYQKEFDQREQNSGVNGLIHYKQGDLKIIPKELFDDGCKKFGLSIKNDIMLLLVKLVLTLLVFLFVFLILRSDSVSNPATTNVIIAFLAVAYVLINIAIIGGEFQIFEPQADKVVNDYIARKQQGLS